MVNAQIVGHPAAYGFILLRRHGPGQGNHEPQAGLLRGMLVGGVDRHGAAVDQVEGVQKVRQGKVGVQGQQSTMFQVDGLPPPLLQPAAHEATHVLNAVLFVLAHLEIFLDGFLGGHRPQEGGQEL